MKEKIQLIRNWHLGKDFVKNKRVRIGSGPVKYLRATNV